MLSNLKLLAARFALFSILSLTIATHKLGMLLPFNSDRFSSRPRRIVMIGTFYNPGWFVAHATPLSRSNFVDEIIVLSDRPVDIDIDKVSFYCPSERMISIFGRMISRFLSLISLAVKYRPQIYMGYHIMPNAPFALIGARLFSGYSIYQMTGGPIQIVDGGFRSENPLLNATKKPSKAQETMLYALVRSFDAIVVRGGRAGIFLRENHLSNNNFIITGAIDVTKFKPDNTVTKDYDIVTVTRLVPNKGVEAFLDCVYELKKHKPNIKAAIVGGGPLQQKLEQSTAQLDIKDNVFFLGKLDQVNTVLTRSRLFVLLSPSEGMSIAMLEAMSCGLPVVVTDVGDLQDVIRGHGSGILLESNNATEAAQNILSLLNDENLYESYSKSARDTIISYCSVDAITARWDQQFKTIFK